MKNRKHVVIEMRNGNVYEDFIDSYLSMDSIVAELNDNRTLFMNIGGFVFMKDQVWTISVEEVNNDGTD